MCLKTTQHFVPKKCTKPSFPSVQPTEWDCVWCYCWRQWKPACSQWDQISLVYLIPCLQWRRGMSSSLSSIIMRYVISLSVCIVATPACIIFIIYNPSNLTAQKKEYVNMWKKYKLIFPLYKHFYAPWFLQNVFVIISTSFFYFIQDFSNERVL